MHFLLPLNLVMLSAFYPAYAQYLVMVLKYVPDAGYKPLARCEASGADFGARLAFDDDVIGCAQYTDPSQACSPVRMPTPARNGSLLHCASHMMIAMVPRGNCSFSEKAYYSQEATPDGYRALLIYNDPGQKPIAMSGDKHADDVTIPVAMIAYECMTTIMQRYPMEKGFLVMIKGAPGYYDLVKYLIPFVAVVGFCFFILLIALIVRLCREHREVARRRLSRRALRKLPTRKFKKGEEPETCPICLDDFVEGEKLRILPCRHAYHCKCVDPWLTKNRKVCPVCKRKVGGGGDDSSDSDAERNAHTAAGTRERDPLLLQQQNNAASAASPAVRQIANSTFYPMYHSTDEELAAGPMVLSPPASPERDIPTTSTQSRSARRSLLHGRGTVRPAPPSVTISATVHSSEGDLLASTELSSSTEQLIPPPAKGSRQRGVENNAFVASNNSPPSANQQQQRRKRHPAAAGGGARGHVVDTRLSLEDDDETSESGSDKESEVGPPMAQSTMPTAAMEPRQKKLKKRSQHRAQMRKNRAGGGVAASAPANPAPLSGIHAPPRNSTDADNDEQHNNRARQQSEQEALFGDSFDAPPFGDDGNPHVIV